MSLSADALTALLSAWLWPFFRIAALVSAAPVFGGAYVPPRVRLALAAALALVVAPLVAAPAVDPLSAAGGLLVAEQVLVGLLLGLGLRLALVVFDLAGQVIAQTMGLGFASMVDPASGTQVPVVSQLYLILATLVIVSIDGHLLMLRLVAESFQALPVGASTPVPLASWDLVSGAAWVFAAGAVMALPAVTAMLVVNLAFGVMTRAAPQLNVFAVGFPITLLTGLVVILLTLQGSLADVGAVLDHALGLSATLLGESP